MSEALLARLEFTTASGFETSVGVTRDWQTIVHDRPIDRYAGEPAIVVGGFILAQNGLMFAAAFYETAYNFYTDMTENSEAEKILGQANMQKISGFGKYLTKMINPQYSPFRTNILRLNIGEVRPLIFVCSDTSDEDRVVEVVKSSRLSENTNANELFQNKALNALGARGFIKLGSTNYFPPETNTVKTAKKVEPISEPEPAIDPEPDNVVQEVQSVEVVWVAPEDVLRATADYLLALSPGDTILGSSIFSVLSINQEHDPIVINAINILCRAGYLSVARDDTRGIFYRRTDKVHTATETS